MTNELPDIKQVISGNSFISEKSDLFPGRVICDEGLDADEDQQQHTGRDLPPPGKEVAVESDQSRKAYR